MKLLILFALTGSLFANLNQAPQDFQVKAKTARFIDFKSGTYNITYNASTRKAKVKATIKFYQAATGYPLFDLVSAPNSVYIDGRRVSQSLVSLPTGISKMRMIQSQLRAGEHTLTVYAPIERGTSFSNGAVNSGFRIGDLSDRGFKEKYLPTNLEYDQYSMTYNVTVTQSRINHKVYANGNIKKLARNKFSIVFPKRYTTSSPWFHIAPIGKYRELSFNYSSINSKKIPVLIYSTSNKLNSRFKKETLKVLKELEADYGAWPHEQVLIFGTGTGVGGMEYVGATVTRLKSLGHELQHGYFAKGVQPANGNSGWIDEAVATWRGWGHPIRESVGHNGYNLGGHSQYQRNTDRDSYTQGGKFIGFMDGELRRVGMKGMRDFLRLYFQKRNATVATTEQFISDLTEYSGKDFTPLFNKYVMGKNLTKASRSVAGYVENPHHPEMTEQEWLEIIR